MSNIGRITGVFNTPASGTTVITVDDAFAVHFWYSRADADDTVQANQQFGHGWAAGSDRDSGMTAGQDGVNQNQRDGRNDAWCLITDAAGTADLIVGNIVTFNASNITLSYTTVSIGWRIHYEIWYGTDGSAEIRQVAASTSPLSDLTMATPDMVFCWTLGQGHPASSIHGYQSFGVAVDNAGIDQWVQYTYMGDSDTDSVGSALVAGDIAGQYNVDFANWTMQITAIGSNGCTWTGTNADQIIFMFLDLAGDPVHVGTFAKSTASAPTTQQMPTFGFTPDGYGIATCNFDLQTIDTNRIVVNSFGAYDEETGVGHSAISVGTPSSNSDRASASSPTTVLAGSVALQANGLEWAGAPDAITDATPSIEWNPNTTGGTDDVIIGVYGHEEQFPSGGDQGINVVQATEDDVANGITVSPGNVDINVGQSVETNLAQSITISTFVDAIIDQAIEVDISQSITVVPGVVLISVGQANEVDLSQSITIVSVVSITLGQAFEVDISQAITISQITTISIGQSTETDISQVITVVPGVTLIAIGQALETDLSQVITPNQLTLISVNQVIETDIAQSITVQTLIVISINQAVESDIAQIISIDSPVTISIVQANETDLAQSLIVFQTLFQTVDAFRWYNDDGVEAAATPIAAQNVSISQLGSISAILRYQINNVGDAPAQQIIIQVKKTSDPDTAYIDVPVAA